MRRSAVALALAWLIAFGLARCGGGGGNSTPANPTPLPPSVTGVAVTGPSNSAKSGDSGQFTATATLSNGTNQNVTSQATWQSSDTNVATVSSSGMVTAANAGEADIKATYQAVTGSMRLTVTAPPPTGPSISGLVTEEGTTITIAGATVIVKDTSLSTTSDGSGRYSIGGVTSGRIILRATKSGYQMAEVEAIVSGATTKNIPMRRDSAPSPTPTPTPTPTPVPTPTPGPNGPTCDASTIPSNAVCIGDNSPPVTAVCEDGRYGCARNRQGSCSQHGGVKCWVCPGLLCNGIVPVPWADYTPVRLEHKGS
jgi:hypothetical protein